MDVVRARQAYEENEGVLDGVASGLKEVANQSVSDLGRLFGKLGTRFSEPFFRTMLTNLSRAQDNRVHL